MSKFLRMIMLLALISAFFVPTSQTLAESGVQPLVLENQSSLRKYQRSPGYQGCRLV